MDRKNPQDRNRSEEISAEEALESAPPGSGVINSSRSGQAVSENPVIRADRDTGDVLAEQVRAGRREGGGVEREGLRNAGDVEREAVSDAGDVERES